VGGGLHPAEKRFMSLRTKLLIIAGVIALAVFAFYPPEQKVNLGLDLKGGVHLVLRVQTDDALRVETELTAERLRERLRTENVAGTVTVASPMQFRVEGVQDTGAVQRAGADAETVFDRSSGAGTLTYTMKPNVANQVRD
jgi:preprotein translocase subunit SecD